MFGCCCADSAQTLSDVEISQVLTLDVESAPAPPPEFVPDPKADPEPFAPRQAPAAKPPDGAVESECTLVKANCIECTAHFASKKLIVNKDVNEGDLNPGSKRPRCGDAIVAVNGVSEDAAKMQAELANADAAVRVWRFPVFPVELTKSSQALGMRLSKSKLEVQSIADGGVIQAYNKACDAEKVIMLTDIVEEANGQKGTPVEIRELMLSAKHGEMYVLTIRRKE